jgi:hypothetical protein
MAEDLEFREFFASQFAPLRRLDFCLTGDWASGGSLRCESA